MPVPKEIEAQFIELLALIYAAVPWKKMSTSRNPWDVFNHRVRAAATRATLGGFVSRLCNWFGLQSLPLAARGRISERLARLQAAEYARRGPSVWCVSNPGLRGRSAKLLGIESVFGALKREFGAEWVHCLGAGWDAEDLREWAQCDGLDSFDSIAHYTNPAFSTPLPPDKGAV